MHHLPVKQPPVGIFAWFGMRIPFEERMRMVAAAGFRATALWWEDRHPEGRRLRHLGPGIARDQGLDVDHIHVPYRGCNALWTADAAARTEAVDRHLGWIADCARHGVETLVMHASCGRPPGLDWSAGEASFETLADAASEAGVALALENTRENDLVAHLLGTIDSPALRLCYDVAHDRIHGRPFGALPKRFGRRIAASHLGDTDGKRDYHWLPGDGCIDWPEEVARLRRWDAPLVLEVVNRDAALPAPAFLARAYERIQAAIRGAAAREAARACA